MNKPKDKTASVVELYEKLDELEHLLVRRKQELNDVDKNSIPVLRDLHLFSNDDCTETIADERELPLFDDQELEEAIEIAPMSDPMEEKIADELDSVLNLLKKGCEKK